MSTVQATAQLIDETLREREIEYTRPTEETFVVVLPGERKLKTTVLLTVGKHGVRIESFVCRKPDENFEGVYKFLLRRNRRLYWCRLHPGPGRRHLPGRPDRRTCRHP